MFLAVAAVALASCNAGFKKGDAGLLYNIHVDKDGPSIKDGDFISVNLVAKTDADSVLFSTYEAGHPAQTVVQKSPAKGDIFSGLKMLSEGDSATIKVNIDSTIKKGKDAAKPPFKGKYIIYEVKVLKVIPKGNLTDEVFNARLQAYLKSEADLMRKEEPIKIKKYVTDSKLKFSQTPSGLNYIITQPGSGPVPNPGDTVVVNYTVKMLSGKVMESSVRAEAVKAKLPVNPMPNAYKPIRFPVGVAGMIQGMDEGIRLLNKGAKATLVLPSAIAYGERGNGQIQPFTTLVFDVELVDIVHPNPNAPKPAVPVAAAPPVQQPVKK